MKKRALRKLIEGLDHVVDSMADRVWILEGGRIDDQYVESQISSLTDRIEAIEKQIDILTGRADREMRIVSTLSETVARLMREQEEHFGSEVAHKIFELRSRRRPPVEMDWDAVWSAINDHAARLKQLEKPKPPITAAVTAGDPVSTQEQGE